MASNSLFSTVTPCQQNFFWGEYHFPAPCCVWIGLGGSGHRKDLGSGGEAWVVELMGFEESGRRCWNWSDVLGPDEWRGSAEVMEDPAVKVQAFVADKTPNYHQGFFSFFFVHPKKTTRKENLPIEIPVFILCDVYKYFPKREMICLCNIPLDLQSDAIAEPKTKARVIFLTDVNRRCTREFTVEHWNKMWGDYWAVCVGRLCLRIEKKY